MIKDRVEHSLKSIASNINIAIANAAFNTMMEELLDLIRGDEGIRLIAIVFKQSYLRKIMFLSRRCISTKLHFVLHLLNMIFHVESSFLK